MVIKLFADGADLTEMRSMWMNKAIKGFTTNPTLCRKAGVTNYEAFAKEALKSFPGYPISLEVFSDDMDGMYQQAVAIDSWGDDVYVKIPVVNTKGESTAKVVHDLAAQGISVNVTAIMCDSQIDDVFKALTDTPAIISVFAGRIADTGRNPDPMIRHAVKSKWNKNHEVLWASPRQVLDVYTAESLDCDIITITQDILTKMRLEGKNLLEYSRETAAMFHSDARAAGYTIQCAS